MFSKEYFLKCEIDHLRIFKIFTLAKVLQTAFIKYVCMYMCVCVYIYVYIHNMYICGIHMCVYMSMYTHTCDIYMILTGEIYLLVSLILLEAYTNSL